MVTDNAVSDSGLPAIVKSSEGLAGIFAALGDPTRLKLIAVLCAGGAFSIAQLTANTDISRQGVTKHLQVLSDAGVVRDVRQGRERLWQLEPEQINEAKRTLEAIGREWEVALEKLKAYTESL
ncbi:MAG TPA: metalloregulator ArsR/SmtB family transcription factor [Methylophilaceae bacterium]|jgi:DNA-binding transcriptional ArsR family regulator